MKPIAELQAFAEGYREAALIQYEGCVDGVDHWVVWGGYHINLYGSYYGIRIEGNDTALSVEAYPENWTGRLPDPIHSFDIKGESK
jgi:hypothetical protein